MASALQPNATGFHARAVDLDEIRVDGGTQPRTLISDALVRQYAADLDAGANLPPVDLFYDGAVYWLGDGFHRVYAARLTGRSYVPATVHAGTRRDAILFAAGANQQHGVPRTHEDKRAAITRVLQDAEWAQWTNAEIGKRCGASPHTVAELRGTLTVARQHDTAWRPPADPPTPPLGPLKFKSRRAVAERRERMREMADSGHTSRQIAGALGISVEGAKDIAKKSGIAVKADAVVGRPQRHDSTRILEHLVMDAENLVADVSLINFAAIDRSRLQGYSVSLAASLHALGRLVRRIKKEQQHGETDDQA